MKDQWCIDACTAWKFAIYKTGAMLPPFHGYYRAACYSSPPGELVRSERDSSPAGGPT